MSLECACKLTPSIVVSPPFWHPGYLWPAAIWGFPAADEARTGVEIGRPSLACHQSYVGLLSMIWHVRTEHVKRNMTNHLPPEARSVHAVPTRH